MGFVTPAAAPTEAARRTGGQPATRSLDEAATAAVLIAPSCMARSPLSVSGKSASRSPAAAARRGGRGGVARRLPMPPAPSVAAACLPDRLDETRPDCTPAYSLGVTKPLSLPPPPDRPAVGRCTTSSGTAVPPFPGPFVCVVLRLPPRPCRFAARSRRAATIPRSTSSSASAASSSVAHFSCSSKTLALTAGGRRPPAVEADAATPGATAPGGPPLRSGRNASAAWP